MVAKNVEYFDQDVCLKGYLSYNDEPSFPKPAVMIVHDWSGHNAFSDQKADYIADLGYVGFAIDIYGDGKTGANPEECTKLMQPFLDDRLLLQQRLLAAFDAIKQYDCVDNNKIAIMGYCFGGLCALDLARSGVLISGAVSFHGLFIPPIMKTSKLIYAKILALHGYDDPMVPPEQINGFAKEMTLAKADWQIHMYGNTMHAFTNPNAHDVDMGTVYNEIAKNRAEESLENFLKEIF